MRMFGCFCFSERTLQVAQRDTDCTVASSSSSNAYKVGKSGIAPKLCPTDEGSYVQAPETPSTAHGTSFLLKNMFGKRNGRWSQDSGMDAPTSSALSVGDRLEPCMSVPSNAVLHKAASLGAKAGSRYRVDETNTLQSVCENSSHSVCSDRPSLQRLLPKSMAGRLSWQRKPRQPLKAAAAQNDAAQQPSRIRSADTALEPAVTAQAASNKLPHDSRADGGETAAAPQGEAAPMFDGAMASPFGDSVDAAVLANPRLHADLQSPEGCFGMPGGITIVRAQSPVPNLSRNSAAAALSSVPRTLENAGQGGAHASSSAVSCDHIGLAAPVSFGVPDETEFLHSSHSLAVLLQTSASAASFATQDPHRISISSAPNSRDSQPMRVIDIEQLRSGFPD